MSNKLKPKISVSEELLSTSAYDNHPIANNLSNSFHSPYEIFRNNTTAVEVIVKEIRHKGKRKIITNIDKDSVESTTIIKQKEDIEKLRRDLRAANSNLEETQRCFKVILYEMKKQLEGANQRELQTQTKNLSLQLEKEKLRMLLYSKSNLVTKLKKELTAMRQMLKVIVKGIRFTQTCLHFLYYSDIEYDEFEKGLKNNALLVAAGNSSNNRSGLESRL